LDKPTGVYEGSAEFLANNLSLLSAKPTGERVPEKSPPKQKCEKTRTRSTLQAAFFIIVDFGFCRSGSSADAISYPMRKLPELFLATNY
jgi:hypothetical protein